MSMRYQAGTLFLMKNASPWSGPCAACGRRSPRRYEVVAGRRKLRVCQTHKPLEGVETSTSVCEIDKVEANGYSYTVLRVIDMRNPPPGTSGRRPEKGGMTAAYFDECIASGRIIVTGVPQ